ncbi:serpin B3-like [Rana temporaria]|uniref:serpin B3-like n=1 Tax=Rana temporaria TaxID=8407 RepID=UPI001AAC6884|nr:serpin B3-like [Rana temporaria]XP_040209548.1 serpin B3-like [Rana temporaria]
MTMEPISNSIGEFALDIFKEINRSNSDSNILCSPVSLANSLSLLLLGSREETSSQIANVLHISNQGDPTGSLETHQGERTWSGDECEHIASASENVVPDVHSKLKALFNKLKTASDSELKIGNGLFTQLNFPILKSYLESAQTLYQANLKSVDFGKDKTRECINTWVEAETNGKIKNLFAPNSLDKNTSLILVNAIYFKGKWMKTFKKDNTKNALFHVKEDVKIPVPMMSQTERFNHGIVEEMDVQFIELPYENEDFSMFIFLPNKISGLQKVIEQMTLELLMKSTDSKNMQKTKLEIHIPHFKIEESYDLTSHLKNMGMLDAFSQKANLSGISGVGLFVSKVIHKAFIEVNEEGTEAAAATGIVIQPKSATRQFVVNHPFFVLIKHNATNTILFCLKFCSPSS